MTSGRQRRLKAVATGHRRRRPGPARSPSKHGRQTTRDHGVLIMRKLIAWVFMDSLDGLLADPARSTRRVDRRRCRRATHGRSARSVRQDHRPRSRRGCARRLRAQGAPRRRGNGPEPYGRATLGWKCPSPGSVTTSDRVGHRRRQPQRRRHARTHLDAVAAAGLLADIGTLHLDRAATPARSATGSAPIASDSSSYSAGDQGARREEAASPARAAMDRRGDKQVVVELWPAPAQHRPPYPPPTRRALPRNHGADHRPAHRLARPLEPHLSAYPLRS
jgi:hypothetical protein